MPNGETILYYVLSVLKVWKLLFVMSQLKRPILSKNDFKIVYLASHLLECTYPTIVAWQLGHISL